MNKNKIFNGDLIVKSGEVYDYEEVTGSIDANGAREVSHERTPDISMWEMQKLAKTK